MRKPAFAYGKTKVQISCVVTVQLISVFIFTTKTVQCFYFLNPKLRASSHLVWLSNQFVSNLVRNPEDRSSHDTAHFVFQEGQTAAELSREAGYDYIAKYIEGFSEADKITNGTA